MFRRQVGSSSFCKRIFLPLLTQTTDRNASIAADLVAPEKEVFEFLAPIQFVQEPLLIVFHLEWSDCEQGWFYGHQVTKSLKTENAGRSFRPCQRSGYPIRIA